MSVVRILAPALSARFLYSSEVKTCTSVFLQDPPGGTTRPLTDYELLFRSIPSLTTRLRLALSLTEVSRSLRMASRGLISGMSILARDLFLSSSVLTFRRRRIAGVR